MSLHLSRFFVQSGRSDRWASVMAALPGFGKQKSQIFVALLAKQLHIRPPGWDQAAGSYSEEGSFRSVADVHDADSLAKVRMFKQEQKKAQRASAE